MSEDELRQHRLDKLERIRDRGDEPFKYVVERSCTVAEARAAFEKAESEANDPEAVDVPVAVAGRLLSMRGQGKVTFANLRDQSGQIQLFFRKNDLGDDVYETIKDLDLGDFLQVKGHVFRTRTEEVTVRVESYAILTKSLKALPEKHHGLSDVETRYRQRYLDMVANPEVLDTFRKRIQLVESMRQWLIQHGYLEVETPMLQPIPGGASARPFITHHNTYDRDLYLRIAPELYLKRLVVGGFERVFEINRSFRNEGVDTRHNPEFTMMELYCAYEDYMGLMDQTEALFVHCIEAVSGGTSFDYQGDAIDAKRPWRRLTLYEAIREYAGIDLESTRDRDEAAKIVKEAGIEVDAAMGYGKIVDEVLKERVQVHLVQPTFLYDYPIELSPLAKRKRDGSNLTERFQAFIGRLELCNAFSELNDPVDQRQRFMDQVKERERGDEEAQYLDEDYITALEVGLPPTAGLGIGIDRLAMLLTDSTSIREVIFFPQLRTIN